MVNTKSVSSKIISQQNQSPPNQICLIKIYHYVLRNNLHETHQHLPTRVDDKDVLNNLLAVISVIELQNGIHTRKPKLRKRISFKYVMQRFIRFLNHISY